METVKYCSIVSFGDVAGFNWSRDRLRLGDGARNSDLLRETWGDSFGGLSDIKSFVSFSILDTGVMILIGWTSTFEGILFISFKVIFVGDFELCIREVVLCSPLGSPG